LRRQRRPKILSKNPSSALCILVWGIAPVAGPAEGPHQCVEKESQRNAGDHSEEGICAACIADHRLEETVIRHAARGIPLVVGAIVNPPTRFIKEQRRQCREPAPPCARKPPRPEAIGDHGQPVVISTASSSAISVAARMDADSAASFVKHSCTWASTASAAAMIVVASRVVKTPGPDFQSAMV